jgi:ribonuclease D
MPDRAFCNLSEYAIMHNMTKYRNSLPLPTLVDTAHALSEMLSRLVVEPVVAVDTESNSLYAYTERVCLLQFSVPGEDYLVDPFAVEDLSLLGALFSDPEIEKVFHAAEYDVMVLRRDYGFEFATLFDTMIASRIVGWPRYGLGNLLEEHFGVQTDKRMQRTDWGRRPLAPEQLEYAQLDTHFLLQLRDRLLAELSNENRLKEARSAFERVAQSEWADRPFDPDGFWRMRGASDLDDASLAVLRALYVYRDQRAQALDRPPFKVLSDHALLDLSRQTPRSLSELGRIRGLPRRLPHKVRRKLLSVIEQGLRDDPPQRPEPTSNDRPDREEIDRYEALRRWRNQRAESRGVEPDVVLSNRTLHVLAEQFPTSPEALDATGALSDWERQEYGREIVALLRRQRRIR